MEVDLKKARRRFLRVEYPGYANDVSKVLETLGGTKTIAETLRDPHKRPELRFRPGDTDCQVAFGSRRQTADLLLRVRKKKRTGPGSDDDNLKIELVGIVDTVFTFEAPADFQFIPPGLDVDSKTGKSRHNLSRTELMGIEFLEKKEEIYMPPAMFSYTDKPHKYGFDSGISFPDKSAGKRLRPKRPSYAILIDFNGKTPSECREMPGSAIPEDLRICKKLFEERPIWSRGAVSHVLNLSDARTKDVLCRTAYYFSSGPWKRLWVRLGYDPRKNPESRKYQGIDYRVKTPYQRDAIPSATGSLTLTRLPPGKRAVPDYIFDPTRLLQQRQFRYQICDIRLEEVEGLLKESEISSECTEKDGWFGSGGVLEKIRQAMRCSVDRMIEIIGSASHDKPIAEEDKSILSADNSFSDESDE
ncbi:general transcription factor 3C polypeptide 5-like [Oscarella lobularis]|uniref:general transcription factor 3C polypeptide 5-like n=1 Tax=Oscarella lobularis TaxID=121494 RepID=UPI0033131494